MVDVSQIINKLQENGYSVATAESCTGGKIANSLVDIPGASFVFNEGYVTYSNEAKMKNLGVKQSTLDKYGAVSKQTAVEMAMGVKERAKADFGISSTGIAGPDGGTDKKPVGLVYIACAYGDNKCAVSKLLLKGSRNAIRDEATFAAHQLLDDCIKKLQAN
ncbi:MAG: CinA family protein [Pseudobutyrivibrio sp.]|nr:CinA family protein [Pseudobutyrivibrio sp.]